jgi:UDP-N-acetylglucosamine 1-carboxyvinyltransferase
MSKFVIKGSNNLSGEWKVQGMKNAATPVLAATLLTREPCTIRNVPRISDINHMLEILEDLGAIVSWEDNSTLKIHTPEIKKHEMNYLLTKRMRSSVLFMGPVLSVLGKIKIPEPGGCNLGNRSLDTHILSLESLGANVVFERDGYYTISSDKLQAGTVELAERSVTATENILMVASRLEGTTTIKNAASEPHIVCLCSMLISMGTSITGEGTSEITIKGAKELKGIDFEIIPDQLEIGTIAILASLCGDIRISPVIPKHMKAVKEKLIEAGVSLEETDSKWIVKKSTKTLKSFKLTTAPHPGFPTDLQAPFGLLATQAQGTSKIYDPMFESRLGYIEELIKMGANAKIQDNHTAVVTGPTELRGAILTSLDLRAGATLIIAALKASGETIIHESEIIDRGYELIDKRLQNIGADISRVE